MVGGQPSRACKQWQGLAAVVHRQTTVRGKAAEDFGRHTKASLSRPYHANARLEPLSIAFFFVSRALVSLSLSVTGKKRREG